ncbi:MAG TPA: chloride channel protein [Xanthobacteraceae bacterium]|nr:chloride channel protein [Xanthobacteraceae bacterium]
MTAANSRRSARTGHSIESRLGDFSADPRVLILVAMAVIVGAAGAGAAWLLIKLIALVTNLAWFGRLSFAQATPAQAVIGPWTVVVPALGGLIVGLMARFGSEKIRGHGIPEAIEAILIGGSRMDPKVAVLKPLSSAISIGSGGPFGAEGPIIMTGGALGSLFAQCFHMSAAERKTLLVAGAAAGMTAIFGTPLAAVALAVELLLFEWKPRSFIPVVAACAVSIALRPLLFAPVPLFPYPQMPDLPWWGLLACALVGIVGGLQSGLCTRCLYAGEDLFERLPIHWMWWPVIGGVFVGLGGMIEPRALGVGYDVIADLVNGHMTLAGVAMLLWVKAVIWIIALASGTSGGVLAPLLILGGALGWIEGTWLPGGSGLWAIIGMGAMMGGTMRAPLTGTLFAIELTGNVHLLVPLLVATTAAYAVTVLLLKRSILTEKISRRGQHITREYAIDPLQLARVADVMVKDVDTLPREMTIEDAVAFFTGEIKRHRSYPVVDSRRHVVGMVDRGDVLRWMSEGVPEQRTLDDLLSDASAVVGHPGEIVADLVYRMVAHDVGRVPIVEPATRRLVGLVARKDLMRVRAASRRLDLERQSFFGRSVRKPGAPVDDEIKLSG